jgi:hypothetical protein
MRLEESLQKLDIKKTDSIDIPGVDSSAILAHVRRAFGGGRTCTVGMAPPCHQPLAARAVPLRCGLDWTASFAAGAQRARALSPTQSS